MRRKAFAGSFLTVALLVEGPVAAWADDVSDGDAAFHNGHYAKAIKLLMPLAKKGKRRGGT